jgi:riboflavin-specific deaminase-like protein
LAEVQRLLPDPGPTTIEAQLDAYRPWEEPGRDRPRVAVCMATTLDGHATIEGKSGPIGSGADTELLHRLRGRVDAVLIGAGTMRAERYGRLIPDPQLRARRERIGLPHDPLAVIVSASLDLPWDAPLFTEGGGRVLVFTESEAEPPATRTSLRVVRRPGRVDLAACLAHLRRERGIRALLCEGGPRLHAQLRAAGLIDELFLTIAPKLAGDGGPRILEGDLAGTERLELLWLLEHRGELFARCAAEGPRSAPR